MNTVAWLQTLVAYRFVGSLVSNLGEKSINNHCHPDQSWEGQDDALMVRQTALWIRDVFKAILRKREELHTTLSVGNRLLNGSRNTYFKLDCWQ